VCPSQNSSVCCQSQPTSVNILCTGGCDDRGGHAATRTQREILMSRTTLRSTIAALIVGCFIVLATPSMAASATPRLPTTQHHQTTTHWYSWLLHLLSDGDTGWGMDPNG
jgi:hypothetical protein